MARFAYIVLFFALTACSKTPTPDRKPLLLVSIAPYQTLVQRVAGEAFEVETVVPPNANPHSYEPTSKQAALMNQGTVWFRIGELFEEKLLPLLPNIKVVDLREGVSMIENGGHCKECGQDHFDRHIWLSPKQTAKQVSSIAQRLQKMYPDKAEGLKERAKKLTEELDLLDKEIGALLVSSHAKTFLVSHPAFAYFCRDYDLTQLSVEQEGKEPRPKEIEQVYRSAIRTHTEIAIALPQHNNKGAQLIAEKLRIPVRVVDPYSAAYFETIRKLAGLIANPYQIDHE